MLLREKQLMIQMNQVQEWENDVESVVKMMQNHIEDLYERLSSGGKPPLG